MNVPSSSEMSTIYLSTMEVVVSSAEPHHSPYKLTIGVFVLLGPAVGTLICVI